MSTLTSPANLLKGALLLAAIVAAFTVVQSDVSTLQARVKEVVAQVRTNDEKYAEILSELKVLKTEVRFLREAIERKP